MAPEKISEQITQAEKDIRKIEPQLQQFQGQLSKLQQEHSVIQSKLNPLWIKNLNQNQKKKEQFLKDQIKDIHSYQKQKQEEKKRLDAQIADIDKSLKLAETSNKKKELEEAQAEQVKSK